MGKWWMASLVYKMLEQDKPYIVEVEAQDQLFSRACFGKDEEIRDALSFSLLVAGERVGVMFINHRTRHRFTSDELNHIELFGHQAAAAIYITQLYDEARKSTAHWKALYDAGKSGTGSSALPQILSGITEQACLITGRSGVQAHFSYLALLEGTKLKIMSAYPASYLPELQKAADNLDFEQSGRIGITGQAVKFGEAQLVDNVARHPEYIPGDPGHHL